MQKRKQDEWDTGGKKNNTQSGVCEEVTFEHKLEGQMEANLGQFQKGELQAEGTTNVLRLERI